MNDWVARAVMLHPSTGVEHSYTVNIFWTIAAAAACCLGLLVTVAWRSEGPSQWVRGASVATVSAGVTLLILAFAPRSDLALSAVFPDVVAAAVGTAVIAALALGISLLRGPRLLWALAGALWICAQLGMVDVYRLGQRAPNFAAGEGRPVQVGRTHHIEAHTEGPYVEGLHVTPAPDIAPSTPGAVSVPLRASNDWLIVESRRDVRVVRERGDPLLPLEPGNRWTFAGPDGAGAELTVDGVAEENGLLLYNVRSSAWRRDGEQKLVNGGDTAQVYEADGAVYRLDGAVFFESAYAAGDGTDGSGCSVSMLDCHCSAQLEPPRITLPGPRTCTGKLTRFADLLFLPFRLIAGLASPDSDISLVPEGIEITVELVEAHSHTRDGHTTMPQAAEP